MNEKLRNYFLYLRDVSHKIAVSTKWSQCLRTKKKKGLPVSVIQTTLPECIYQFSANGKYTALNQIAKYLQGTSDKSAFLGIFAITGKVDTTQTLGSIFNIPIEHTIDSTSRNVDEVFFDVDNMVVNYQLLLKFFKHTPNENVFFEFNQSLKIIVDYFRDDELHNEKHHLKNLDSLVLAMRNIVETFFQKNNISIIERPCSLEEKQSLKDEDASIDFDNTYIFAFDVPDEISTWRNLDNFCQELQESDKLDSNLLNNILGTDTMEESHQEAEPFDETIFNLLPITLSDSQKNSIINAFTEEISYVQGPPGTGKSHTISAMAFVAMYTGKRILIVSQKDSALRVVKNKINQAFTAFEDKDFLPYIYFDKSKKRGLKTLFERFLEKNKNNKSDFIHHLGVQHKSSSKQFKNHFDKYLTVSQTVNDELNKQYDFSRMNMEYSNIKNLFIQQFDIEKYFPIPLSTENISFISLLHHIETEYKNTQGLSVLNRLRLRNMNQVYNSTCKLDVDFFDLLKSGILFSYISESLKLSNYLYLLNKKQHSLATKKSFDNSITLRDFHFNHSQNYKSDNFLSKVRYDRLQSFYSIKQHKVLYNQFENFAKMLHFQKADIIIEKLKSIDFDNLLSVFNVWLSEIRYIGEILPNQKEMFDLVIIDEASQVNTAEIFPILYRAKKVCVVGDTQQLGLESVGMSFMISAKEESQMWENYMGNYIGYEKAKQRDMVVTTSSFLDLITSNFSNRIYSKTLLDEHFRSMPHLAEYTNKSYYDNNLKIMTATPDKSLQGCFQAFKVLGGQKQDTINEAEAKKVIAITEALLGVSVHEGINISPFRDDGSIGIISLLRDQVERIKELLYASKKIVFQENNDCFYFNDIRIKCGTPEELQGDEFDSVIFSAVVDANSRNTAHYSNSNRFNVATSRAKFYTYFVYTDIVRIQNFFDYLKHFGIQDSTNITDSELFGWNYSEHNFESNFEGYVADYLKEIIVHTDRENLKLFNQIPFAKKRLDFVIYNEKNKKYVAIEVDGQFHFTNDTSRIYSDEHNSRIDLLKRAGWNIINTPYYCWYQNGYIDETYPALIAEKKRLKNEIIKAVL